MMADARDTGLVLDCFGYDAGLVDDELATVRRAGTPFGSTGTAGASGAWDHRLCKEAALRW